jgi:hypothetical protein
MGAKLCAFFTVTMLASGAALANVYKCQTPDGFKYTDKPCPAGSALDTLEAAPASVRPQPQAAQSKEPAQKSQAGVNDMNVVPLPFPQSQRRIYQDFLARPSPRAFGICKDSGTITIVGKADFVKKQMSDIRYGCRLYVVNDEVVW